MRCVTKTPRKTEANELPLFASVFVTLWTSVNLVLKWDEILAPWMSAAKTHTDIKEVKNLLTSYALPSAANLFVLVYVKWDVR